MNRKLATLAFGAFVVAADGTLVVGLLRAISRVLAVSPAAAGQAVSVFGAAYALGGPLLMLLFRRVPQKQLLTASLALFTASNVATGLATTLPSLLGARLLAAASAAVFVPAAAVAATAAVKGEQYGRALPAVVAGASAGTAVGVPAGTLVGAWLGWRTAFYLLAGVAVIVTFAAALFLRDLERPARPGTIAPLRDRRVLMTLAVTGLWALGSFTFFTYVSVILNRTAGVGGAGLALFLLLFGLSGLTGAAVAGWLTDIAGARSTLLVAVPLIALFLAGLGLLAARGVGDAIGVAGSAAMIALYGLGTWAVTPPQQHRLLAIGGNQRLLLSLNASALYAGVALGGAAGGLVLAYSDRPSLICWLAATLELAVIGVLRAWRDDFTPSAAISRKLVSRSHFFI